MDGDAWLTPRRRLLISIAVAGIATAVSFACLRVRGYLGSDFNWLWAAARYWVAGGNPYHNPAFAVGKPYPFWNPLPYPLPAVILSMPFALFEPYLAAALFMGVSSGLLAWGVLPKWRRYAPMFASAPFVIALAVAQWSPLIVAGAFLPMPILALKPNLGLAVTARHPWLKPLVATVAITAVSLVLMPSWPRDWLANLGQHYNPIPILVLPMGPLLLFAAVAWRRPAGRLLLLMAILPQTPFFYDALPLWLIPKTGRQGWVLTACGWAAFFGWGAFNHGWATLTEASAMGAGVLATPGWLVGLTYLPAMVLVLWHEWQVSRAVRTPGAMPLAASD